MKRVISFIIIFLFLIFFINAEEFKIGSGAGYKKPLLKILKIYNSENPKVKIDPIFGNLEMVITQSKQTSDLALIVGDKGYFKNTTLEFSRNIPLGQGIMVLAFSKGKKILKFDEILNADIKRIGIPDMKNAIYGIAGKQYLKSLNYFDRVEGKLMQVKTVPQVVSYLIAEELDAGFINLTEAIAMKDKLGGWINLEQSNYEEIEIVCAVINGFENNKMVRRFIVFLETQKVKGVLKEYGL